MKSKLIIHWSIKYRVWLFDVGIQSGKETLVLPTHLDTLPPKVLVDTRGVTISLEIAND